MNPPHLPASFNQNSLLVVEDSAKEHSDYELGDSVYPYLYLRDIDFHRVIPGKSVYQYPYVYGGTLFRWAYLMPDLKEQVFPFQVEQLQEMTDLEILHNWLQHFDTIFCVGYDAKGNWHDRTAEFKRNLMREKIRRHLVVNTYREIPDSRLEGELFQRVNLPIPDSGLCRFFCDKTAGCRGFTYLNKKEQPHSQCRLFSRITQVTHEKMAGWIERSEIQQI
jgi:hypothetical protein